MAKKTKNTDPPKTREQAANVPGGVSQPSANPEDNAKRIKALLRNRQNYFNALQETNKDSDNESNRIGLEETDNLLTNLGVNTEEVNTYQKHIYDNRDKIDNYKEIASGSCITSRNGGRSGTAPSKPALPSAGQTKMDVSRM